MNRKFFYLYLVGGLLAIGLLIYDIFNTYPKTVSVKDILLDGVPAILLLYLAYKTRREKKDSDLM
jgi:lipid-A-disaccharide synthase-like uncharacterized protein